MLADRFEAVKGGGAMVYSGKRREALGVRLDWMAVADHSACDPLACASPNKTVPCQFLGKV